MTRIFKVELEHLTYGENWSRVNVAAPTALSAIRRAESLERAAGETRTRALEVTLVAETD